MIISIHSHANPTNVNSCFYNDYTLEHLVYEQLSSGIDLGIVCLNPKLLESLCPNDCLSHCIHTTDGSKCSINCKTRNKHRTQISNVSDDNITVFCSKCNKVIYYGSNYLRNYNLSLIYSIQKNNFPLLPLVTLPINQLGVQKEINFYEQNFLNMFIGYKLHPLADQCSVSSLRINSNLPILIHTGLKAIEFSTNAIEFANNYNGNVIISHAGQLNKKSLKSIADSKNLFLDICPIESLFKYKDLTLENNNRIYTFTDIFKFILDIVPKEKLLFGTDAPWGNMSTELTILQKIFYELDWSKNDINDFLFQNASRVFSLNKFI